MTSLVHLEVAWLYKHKVTIWAFIWVFMCVPVSDMPPIIALFANWTGGIIVQARLSPDLSEIILNKICEFSSQNTLAEFMQTLKTDFFDFQQLSCVLLSTLLLYHYFTCVFKLAGCANLSPHTAHWNGLSSGWTTTWCSQQWLSGREFLLTHKTFIRLLICVYSLMLLHVTFQLELFITSLIDKGVYYCHCSASEAWNGS